MATSSPIVSDSLVVYDTEYTTWPDARDSAWGHEDQHREVIQLAGRIVHRARAWNEGPVFSVLIRPVLTPVLNRHTTTLTGITQEQMDAEGLPMAQALERFRAFSAGMWCVSNGNDINPIAETCGLQRILMPLNPRRFLSIRRPLYTALDKEAKAPFPHGDYPSGRVHTLLDLPLPTHQVHDAMHDVNSLAISIAYLEEHGHSILPWNRPLADEDLIDTPALHPLHC